MKHIFLTLLMTFMMCLSSFGQQKVYSDTTYVNGQIVINNYVVENNEKVSVAEPIWFALGTFIALHPWFDYHYPHYGWVHPHHRPYIYRKGHIYRPHNRYVTPPPPRRPIYRVQSTRRTPVHRPTPRMNHHRPGIRPHRR